MKIPIPLEDQTVQVVRYYKGHTIYLELMSVPESSEWSARYTFTRYIVPVPMDGLRVMSERFRSSEAAMISGLICAKGEIDGLAKEAGPDLKGPVAYLAG
ncbi:MAG TPA: hypothetical protein VKZ53_17040 [Candidatus Angelobacter sp.]|nr:hypothetical protein [Candidatus Angelobacter sp.]